MAITYPRTFPSHTGVRSVELRAVNAVASQSSPFTFSRQVYDYGGRRWEADITLPPMRRTDAEQWIAWLVSLKGQYGTFLLGDPVCSTPRGSAATFPGLPLVNGGSQTGDTLVIDGASANKTGWLKAGDYIQLGSGTSARLHKVLEDANSDASGNVTLTIWPELRSSPSDNAAVTVSSAVGAFHLASNEVNWSVNEASIYGITFGAVEALTE